MNTLMKSIPNGVRYEGSMRFVSLNNIMEESKKALDASDPNILLSEIGVKNI